MTATRFRLASLAAVLAAGAVRLSSAPAPPPAAVKLSLADVATAPGAPNPVFQTMLLQGFMKTIAPQGRRASAPQGVAEVRRVVWRPRFDFDAPVWAAGEPAIQHDKVGCVVAGQHPRLDACFPGTEVGRARIFFRSADDQPWYAVDMAAEGGCFAGLLPQPQPKLEQFQYYVDVIDRSFRERSAPETAPDAVNRVRVVAREGDCDKGLRTAVAVARTAAPIVVAGLGAGAAPAGFDPQGVVPARSAVQGVTVSLVATGATSGDVMQLQVVNGGPSSIELISPDAVVVRPVAAGKGPVAARAKGALQASSLTGFCLDFTKPPPAPGTVYELADAPLQQKFRPLGALLKAGRAMEDAGALHPDSDPRAYAESIRQWSVWSHLAGWSGEQFADHFVARTRDNVREMKRPWTPEMEAAVRAAASGRWRDVQELMKRARETR